MRKHRSGIQLGGGLKGWKKPVYEKELHYDPQGERNVRSVKSCIEQVIVSSP
jgi:hypothetical protein